MTPGGGASRFVDVTPAGVLAVLAEPARSPARDLVELLLWRSPAQALDFQEAGLHLGQDVSALARTMFALNRNHWVRVEAQAERLAAPCVHGLAHGLSADLAALGGPRGRLVLGCAEGYCVHALNTDPAEAARVAAGLGACGDFRPLLSVCFARDRITVFADCMPDCDNPAWVSLARRLLRNCGALSFGKMEH